MVRNQLKKSGKNLPIGRIAAIYGKKKEEKNTSIIIKEAKEEIRKLESMIKVVDEFQRDEPQGCLKCQKRGENTYFYQQYLNESTKQWDRKYIKKEDFSLARNLAQKHYYTAIKPILEKNLKELKNLIKQYHPEKIDKIYDDLSTERKNLIRPLQNSKEEIIRKWFEEDYEKNNFYPENLRYETEQGGFVRSKSEVIIANILYQHRKDILYKYERPLNMVIDGKNRIIYPDFTILNIHTGRVTYWEHAGRMDDPNYANNFVKKVNAYIDNNLLPGRDVVCTYESLANPLEICLIKKLVDEIRE